MNKLLRCCVTFFVACILHNFAFAQYILNGSAQKNSCNCYTLTPAENTKSGSVWNSNKIDLTSSFDFWFNVFLGCSEAGADGMVFILQPISTSVGTTGEGMGFSGVSPSIGIALDTYQNQTLGDPPYDHISIQANGNVNHSSDLAGPVPISSTSDNVEDCSWHKLRITWDASTKWLRTYFDGVLRVEKQVDLVATVFNNNPSVYWGFTGATGGAVNLQQFCTALDPIFSVNASNNVVCEGTSVAFTNASEAFAPIASYNWSFGDGTTSTLKTPPPHLYTVPGDYKVTLKIVGQDGCERDSSRTLKVAANPFAQLTVSDTCAGEAPAFSSSSNGTGVTFQWTLDGVTLTGNSMPDLGDLPPGQHRLEVKVISNYGCGQPAVAGADFMLWPQPVVDAVLTDGCVGEDLFFRGEQTDLQTTIARWNWTINGRRYDGQNVTVNFSDSGHYKVKLWAVDTKGCRADTVDASVKVSRAYLVANDTTLLRNTPSQLNVRTNGLVQWSPATGLSNPTIANPGVFLNEDQTYSLTATTPEGCTASDTLRVRVFKGPAVYVPTAFTPNGDGRNELLLPVYVGIKELKEFAVYNRWGERLFGTSNPRNGWNGNAPGGTYVWLVRAVDNTGRPLIVKGTVTLLR